MKLRFNREVRRSVADELKQVSTIGGVGLLGYSINQPVALVAADRVPTDCQPVVGHGGRMK